MEQLVVIKLKGELNKGFWLSLEIGEEGQYPDVEITGNLPPAIYLIEEYQKWQLIYRKLEYSLRLKHKIEDSFRQKKTGRIKPIERVTEDYIRKQKRECQRAETKLRQLLNEWLDSSGFKKITYQLQEQLKRNSQIRILIRGESKTVELLPWHLWHLLEEYPDAEIAFNSIEYRENLRRINPSDRVKILIVLGNRNRGSIVNNKKELEEQVQKSKIKILEEPTPEEFKKELCQEKWDILIFAGHSKTENQRGIIHINQKDSLTVAEIKSDLKIAIEKGLQLAIFNSCDGLGLAIDLQTIEIPHAIVMREPLSDRIFHKFITYFLPLLAREIPLHLAVRASREILRGLDKEYPCSNWLPVIFHGVGSSPLTWSSLIKKADTAPEYPLVPYIIEEPEELEELEETEVLPVCISYHELGREREIKGGIEKKNREKTELLYLAIISSIVVNFLAVISLFFLKFSEPQSIGKSDSEPKTRAVETALNNSKTQSLERRIPTETDTNLVVESSPPTPKEKYSAISSEVKSSQDADLVWQEISKKINIERQFDRKIEASLERAENKFPNDYRFTYQLIQFQVKNNEYRHYEALNLLKKAALKAIENGQARELLAEMNRDKIEIRKIRKIYLAHREWDTIVEALERENPNLLVTMDL